jgi:2-haloalkanoic acid dehalogenase type II
MQAPRARHIVQRHEVISRYNIRQVARARVIHLDGPAKAVAFDLLMAVMNSVVTWTVAAGDRRTGLGWRDAVTARMTARPSYTPYESLVREAARELGLGPHATSQLFDSWQTMSPWPDAAAIAGLSLPYAFVTNTSAALAVVGTQRSGLRPRFVLSAEDAGWYKPDARIYRAACERLGLPPGQVVFVAGSAYDAAGAKRAGLQAAFVPRRADQQLSDAGIPTVTSIEEVVAAIDR